MNERQRLDLIDAAVDQAALVVAVVDRDGRLVALNGAGRAAFGGWRVGALIADDGDDCHRGLAECYHGVLSSGETFVARDWRLDLEAPDGSTHELFVELTITAVRSGDGTVAAALGVGRDVTTEVRRGAETSRLESPVAAQDEVLLQVHDAVLPKGLPVPQGVEMAALYLLAEDERGSGGDWFQAIPLSDGRIVLAVGDVVGQGVEASIVMGELKVLFEERVRREGDLVAALELLDDRARRVREARTTTVCAAVVEPSSGVVTYCTAGHPPPVVVTAAGDASYLPVTGAGPLGSGLGFATAEHVITDGEVLLLYSDGLVERPGRTHVQNTVDLLHAAGAASGAPERATSGEQLVERLCRQTLELLTRVTGYADDITMLALQRVPPVPPLLLRLPAVPGTVRAARAGLGDWLDALRVSALDRTAVQHAVGELVSNAVQHAYPAPGAEPTVSVGAWLDSDGVVEVEVVDAGTWREVRPDGRGRGLALASGFLDELRVEHDGGTRARGRYRVSRPASLLRGTSRGPTPRHLEPAPFALGVDDDVIHVAGALDVDASDALRAALRRSSRGGTRTVLVNLAEADLLSSSAVQTLFDARAMGPVDLIAPMGSPAQHVLDLVRLPYRATA